MRGVLRAAAPTPIPTPASALAGGDALGRRSLANRYHGDSSHHLLQVLAAIIRKRAEFGESVLEHGSLPVQEIRVEAWEGLASCTAMRAGSGSRYKSMNK